jgi:hypothetical protein
MTIVLQHQFWDFVVSETHFEVSLSFGGIPERLVVPFTAVKGFFDPSVQFGLQFDPGKTAEPLPDDLMEAVGELASIEAATKLETKSEDKPAKTKREAASKSQSAGEDKGEPDKPGDGGGAVVSLDAFRKKT